MKDITRLNPAPEAYCTEKLNNIPEYVIDISEMCDADRRFINGLIHHFKPMRILEVGVSQGAGSCVILNAISECPEARLVSIDIDTHWYRDRSKEVGWAAKQMFPDSFKWSLYTGRDPVELMDEINDTYDFCIIDAAHTLPGEILNFLTVFPYLNKNAIVVLHDIALYMSFFENYNYAPCLLYNTVSARKRILDSTGFFPPNIGAFQITEQTRNSCYDVLRQLLLPWRYDPMREDIFFNYFSHHYNEEAALLYQTACKINKIFLAREEPRYSIGESCQNIREHYKKAKRIVLYGAGKRCRKIINILSVYKANLEFEIWDRNAAQIQNIERYNVHSPCWDQLGSEDCMVIVCIDDEKTYSSLKYIYGKEKVTIIDWRCFVSEVIFNQRITSGQL